MRLLFLIGIFVSASGFASPKTTDFCATVEVRINADMKKIKTAEDLGNYYRHYSKCNNAAAAETYNDVVSQLLDEKWSDFLGSKKIKDKNVQSAIIAGIGDDWERNRYLRILEKAKNNCPPNAHRVCASIKKMEHEGVNN